MHHDIVKGVSLVKRTLSDYAQYIFTKYPIITITGPRQSGKTSLPWHTFSNKPYANLENPVLRQFAIEDPIGFLNRYPQGAVSPAGRTALLKLPPLTIKELETYKVKSLYFKGLKKFKKFFPDLPYGQLIIYAGDISQNRTDVKIITINRFSELLEAIDP